MPARRVALFAAVIASVTAGCGGPSPTTTSQPTASAPSSTTPAENTQTIRSDTTTSPAATPTPAPTASQPTSSSPTAADIPLGPRDPKTKVRIAVPQYDAPGSPVSVILTAPGAKGFDVAVAGRRGECVGETWRHAGGTSQRCWITLPTKRGTHTITAHARLGGRHALGTTTIDAAGPNGGAVDAATRDRILTCGNTTRDVWLTFDDGFLSERTMRSMLTTLRRENVQARFFGMGQWARATPRMVEEIRAAGHLVENHTDTHESLNALDAATLRRQITRGPSTDATLLRPGFGAGAFTQRVTDEAARVGQRVCYWNVDTRDWSRPGVDKIVDRVLHGDSYTEPARPGSVILMHMTSTQTAEALPTLIHRLRDEGLTLPPLR